MGVQATSPDQIRQRLFNPQQNPLYPNPVPPPPGAPPDFPGAVLPNPDNRQPQLDTAPPPPTKLSDGASFSHPNAGAPPMDTSNPPMNQMGQPAMREVGTAEPQRGAVSAGMKPVLGEKDFAAQNPDASTAFMAARPVGDFDTGKHPKLRSTLASLFAGLAEFGRPGAGQAFVNRWADQNQQQRTYDANEPKMRAGALHQAYQQYLQQGSEQSNIAHTQQETSNLVQNVPMLQHQQQFLDNVRKLKEDGKYGTDEELFNAVLPEAQTVPGLSRQMIVDTINGAKKLGAKYQIQQDKNGRPEFATDRQGNRLFPDAKGKFQDPELQSQWDSISQTHQQALGEEEGKEKRVAGYAAERQAQTFSNQQTESGRKEASKHLGDLRGAQNQLDLVNKLASSKSPTDQTSLAFKALGLDLPDGVHRINETELNAIRNQGSLSDRAYRTLLNWKAGEQFAPDILEDIKNTASTIASSKMKTANDNLEDVSRVYGYKAPGSDVRGRFDKGQQAGVPDTSQSANQNSGDVIYARDPQGKLHKAAKGTALPQGWKAENAPATK